MNLRRKNILPLLVIICSLAVLAWRFGVPLLRSGRVPEDLRLLRRVAPPGACWNRKRVRWEIDR